MNWGLFGKKKNKHAEVWNVKTMFGPNLNFAATEAYKLLRTNVSFSIPNKATGRIIGLTSPRPQDGKSFSSVNLAYSLAEAGNQVVLIDGDMRRSSLAETLKKPMAPGLSNYLTRQSKLEDLMQVCELKEGENAFHVQNAPSNVIA